MISDQPRGPVVFLCDISPVYGVGHLMRCVALAEEFASRDIPVVFAADVASVPFARDQVESRGYAHVPAPVTVEDHLAVLADLSAEGVVIDSYHQPGALYVALAPAYPTLVLVDGDPGDRVGSVFLDQNIGAEDDTWPRADGSTRLAGLGYALIRTDIRDHRPAEPQRAENDPPAVFAFFGGTDAFGAGPVLTAALVATGKPFNLRVVAPQPWSAVPVAGPGQRITLIDPTDRLAAEVLAADLVISASGTSSWELLCLGAACAFVCVADNQVDGYRRTVEAGLGFGLGRIEEVAADPRDATSVLATALSGADVRAGLRARGWQRVDGAGRTRVVDTFLNARSRSGDKVPRAHG